MLKQKLVVLFTLVAAIGIMSIGLPAAATTTYPVIAQTTDWLDYTGDCQSYTITLIRGQTYKITLVGSWYADFDIRIYDKEWCLVASGTNGRGEDETVYITPRWTGHFTIRVCSYSGSGPFTIRVQRCNPLTSPYPPPHIMRPR